MGLEILGILALGVAMALPINANAAGFLSYSSPEIGGSKTLGNANTNTNTNTGNTNTNTNTTNTGNTNTNTNTNTATPPPAQTYPAPIIYSITPNSAVSGSNDTTVFITGANFMPGSVARFNSINRPTTYYNSTTLSMIVPASDMAGYGSYLVTVYNPVNGAVSNAVPFTLNRNAVTSAAPAAAPVATAKSSGTTAKKTTVASTAKTAASCTDEKSLSANALFGSNGFMPSSFVEWLFTFILILIGIILWRKAYGEEKYRASPLKHA